MKFTPTEEKALARLAQLWPNTRFAVVGASALGCFLEMRWRKTNDLDVTVAVDIDEFPAGLDQVGWNRDPHLDQCWYTPDGLKVDVLPAGGVLNGNTTLVWRDGHEMNMVGFRLPFVAGEQVPLASGEHILVAPPPVVATLKMIAYQDRPFERTRDLEDLAYILNDYPNADDQDRFSDAVYKAHLDFDQSGPFVLGSRIRSIADATEIPFVRRFIAKAQDSSDKDATGARMLAQAPPTWQRDDQHLQKLLTALVVGLDAKD